MKKKNTHINNFEKLFSISVKEQMKTENINENDRLESYRA